MFKSLESQYKKWGGGRLLFVVTFIYTLFVSLLFTQFILPVFLPSLHAGNGIIANTDAVSFHKSAADMANRMREHGISEWRFRPAGLGTHVGLLSLLYFCFVSKPWVFLPISAAFHAGSAVFLFRILSVVLGYSFVSSLIGTLPFIFFPTSLTWNSQIHREPFFIFGVLVWLYGILSHFLDSEDRRIKLSGAIVRFCTSLIGAFFVWLGRENVVFVLSSVALLIGVLMTSRDIFSMSRSILSDSLNRLVLLSVLFVMSRILFSTALLSERVEKSTSTDPQRIAQYEIEEHWNYSSWLPKSIDASIHRMSIQRASFRLHYSSIRNNSTVDLDVRFQESYDVFKYLPRALQIALFAPFPNMWFSSGSWEGGTLARRISTLEMLFGYFAFLGLLLSIKKQSENRRFWFLVSVILVVLTALGISVANLGALYRYRFIFWMLLLSVGATHSASVLLKNESTEPKR